MQFAVVAAASVKEDANWVCLVLMAPFSYQLVTDAVGTASPPNSPYPNFLPCLIPYSCSYEYGDGKSVPS